MDTWIPLLTGHVWSTTFCGIILIDIYPNRYSLVKTIQMHQPMSLLLKRWIRQLDRFLRRFLISYLTDLRLQFDAAMTAPLVSSEQISEISRSQSVPFAGDLRGRRSWFLRCRGRYWAMVQRWGGPPCLVQRCTGDVDLHREVMNKLSLLSRCLWKVVVIVVLEQNSFNTADVQVLEFCALIRDWWVGKRKQKQLIHV